MTQIPGIKDDQLYFTITEVAQLFGIKNRGKLAKEVVRVKLPGCNVTRVPRSEVQRLYDQAMKDYSTEAPEKPNPAAADIAELEEQTA